MSFVVNSSDNLIVIIENPNNISQLNNTVDNIIRLGVDKVYIIKNCDDWKKQSQIYSSINSNQAKIFINPDECFKALVENKFITVAATRVDYVDFHQMNEINFDDIARLAIWFGNEINGISEFALNNCSYTAIIPSVNFINTINIMTSITQVLSFVSDERKKNKL